MGEKACIRLLWLSESRIDISPQQSLHTVVVWLGISLQLAQFISIQISEWPSHTAYKQMGRILISSKVFNSCTNLILSSGAAK